MVGKSHPNLHRFKSIVGKTWISNSSTIWKCYGKKKLCYVVMCLEFSEKIKWPTCCDSKSVHRTSKTRNEEVAAEVERVSRIKIMEGLQSWVSILSCGQEQATTFLKHGILRICETLRKQCLRSHKKSYEIKRKQCEILQESLKKDIHWT